MGEQMGQSFVPDNRAGAGGSVGLAMVAKAPPDGYTVLVTSPAIALTRCSIRISPTTLRKISRRSRGSPRSRT